MPLILCSKTFSISGLGPLLMTVRALACVTERTVAALSQGTPKIDAAPPMATRSKRSKWKPEPFIIFLSGLLTISLLDANNHSQKGKWVAQLHQCRLLVFISVPSMFNLRSYLLCYLTCILCVHQACEHNEMPPKWLYCDTHVVIWDSMKIRIKTRRAGTTEPTIIHTGKGIFSPMGLMNQPRAEVLDTVRPLGTTSFCWNEMTHDCWITPWFESPQMISPSKLKNYREILRTCV